GCRASRGSRGPGRLRSRSWARDVPCSTMALKQPVRKPAGRKPPNQPDPQAVARRSRGALLGLAVGHALCATPECNRVRRPPVPAMPPGLHMEMKGGGPFSGKPGQVTDDTEMACRIASGLTAIGKYDAMDVAKRSLAWRQHAFGVGDQIGKALDEMQG